MKKQQITKESVLEMTQGGLLFYKMVIPNLKVQGDKCRNVTNPFYSDTKPSFSVFCLNGEWFFKDHGDEGYKGDVFKFAAFYFDLDCDTDFLEILGKMSDLDYSNISKNNISIKTTVKNKPYELEKREHFTSFELKYFAKYGITESLLEEYKVLPIDGFTTVNSDGKNYSITRSKNQIMVAYPKSGYAKIYSTNPKTFQSVGNKNGEYIFGKEVIDKQDLDFVFITGGEKDVLTLAGLGYYAFSTNSETVAPSKELLDEFSKRKITIYSIYDNDETGIKQTENLKVKFGIQPISLPETITELGGKDISDYVMNGLTKTSFDKIVKKLIKKPNNMKKDNISEEISTSEIKTEVNIPKEIYENLPPFLQKCCGLYKKKFEKDVVLLSSLTLLSGAIRNVGGIYDSVSIYPPLYFFISAPASSGKGIINLVKLLGDQINDHLMTIVNDLGEAQTLFLEADSSAAAFFEQFYRNNGYGFIWDTEADTLTSTLSKEWGDINSTLRKAYHHERIGSNRLKNKGQKTIKHPFLSTLLCGTPNQIILFFKSVENGLFSRFGFYDFQAEVKWKNVFKNNSVNYTREFLKLGEEVFDLFLKLNSLESEIEFTFTKEQQDLFQSLNEIWLKESYGMLGDDIVATMRRLGVMFFKIAMIISVTRYIDSDEEIPEIIMCSDEDFYTSMEIVNCLKSHSIKVYEKMTKQIKISSIRNPQKLKFFNALPDKFDREIADKIALENGINTNTSDTYLTELVKEKQIFRLKKSSYSKTEVK